MPKYTKYVFLRGIALMTISLAPFSGFSDQAQESIQAHLSEETALVQQTSLLPLANHYAPSRIQEKVYVMVTAYSSTADQTDDTPFITASGTRVRDGVVAANFLPIGTKIRIPSLYGEKVFVVEDRMHPRKLYQVDIWFSTYMEAVHFGAKELYVEVLEG